MAGGHFRERWMGLVGESVEMETEARWWKVLQAWPTILQSASPEAAVPKADDTWLQLMRLRPEITPNMCGQLWLVGDDGQRLFAESAPQALVRLREGRFLARSEEALFSRETAEALAAVLPISQLYAATTLASLPIEARYRWESVERQIARYAPFEAKPLQTVEEFADEEDTKIDALTILQLRASRKEEDVEPPSPSPRRDEIVPVLADIRSYQLLGINRADSVSPTAAAPRMPALHSPRAIEDEREATVRGAPLQPGRRYSNNEIEDAAHPFIDAFERGRGDLTIMRQGPKVGADYISYADQTLDRYIEVKAFSGKAGEHIELTQSEYLAAIDPEKSYRYWVYVIEHGCRSHIDV